MTTQASIVKEKPKSTALQIQSWMNQPTMARALGDALAGYMDQPTFAAQCYLAAQDPKLAQCSPESLFRAFLECAQMGLLPGAHHKHVALVPRAGVITSVPQWQGFKFLMERQPGVKRVHPVLVHAKDKFAIVNGEPDHEYDPFDDTRVFKHPSAVGKGEVCGLRGGYLVIERKGEEDREYHFVSAEKIHKNRECAETQKVWTKWFVEMCMKTVLRDAWAKRIISIDPQLAERLGRADAADNAALGNDPGRAHVIVTGSRTEQLAAKVGAVEDSPDMGKADPPLTGVALEISTAIGEANDPGELAKAKARIEPALAAKQIDAGEADRLRTSAEEIGRGLARAEQEPGSNG